MQEAAALRLTSLDAIHASEVGSASKHIASADSATGYEGAPRVGLRDLDVWDPGEDTGVDTFIDDADSTAQTLTLYALSYLQWVADSGSSALDGLRVPVPSTGVPFATEDDCAYADEGTGALELSDCDLLTATASP